MNTFFAFERELWYESRNVELQLNPFRVAAGAQPVLTRGAEGSPDHHRAVAPSVVHDGERFRMWYTGLALNGGSTSNYLSIKHSLCVAESDDGVRWTKSARDRGPALGNVVLTGHLLAGVDYLPERELYAACVSFAGGTNPGGGETTFCIATSSDGLAWDCSWQRATDIRHFETITGVKRIGDRYWVIGQGVSPCFHLPDGGECGRVVFGFHSQDLVDWTPYEYPLFLYPTPSPFRYCGLQTHLGLTAWPRGRIVLGMVGQLWPGAFSQNVRFTVGLVYSYDGLTWVEPFPQTPVLAPPEDTSAWPQNIIQGNSLYNQRDETLFWFTGGDDKGNTWESRTDIGLASLRRDGFACLVGRGEGERVLVTQPIRLETTDQALYVNASTSAEAPMTVDALDRYMKPLPDLTARITQDGVMQEALTFPTPQATPREIRLRFRWQPGGATRLYGFTFATPVRRRGPRKT